MPKAMTKVGPKDHGRRMSLEEFELAEVQAGYSMGDHLVRAAMVVVSKGPPAGATAAS